MKKVRTLKFIKEVLKNYDGYLGKDDGYYYVSLDCMEEYFATKEDLFAWATHTFWKRNMHRSGYAYGC